MNQDKSKAPLLGLHSGVHLAEQSGGPPSPTTSTASFMSSVSWMAEKSSSDLIPMLKNAYHTLKDKERDLKLAAEIGKSLLENNITMKTKYENLLNNTRSAPIATVLPTPSSSIVTISQRYGSDSGNKSYLENDGSDDEQDEADDTKAMRFVSSQSTREAMIEVLELKNSELNGHLETILEEQSHLDKSNNSKHRQLEQKVAALTDSLDIAANKIQELETMNVKANLQLGSGERSTDDGVDQQLVDELLEQIDNLKTKNSTAAQSKLDLEQKLTHTLQDLRKLKQQFDHFQFTQDDHEDLKAAYERQFRHIDELTSSVEEHRAILQKLEDKGISTHSTHNSAASSHVDGETCSTQGTPDGFRNTLLGDLESEWLQQKQQRASIHPSLSTHAGTSTGLTTRPIPYMKPSLSTLSFNNLSKFTGESIASMYQQSEFGMESVLARAAGVDQKTLEEAIRLVDHLEEEFGGGGGDGSDDDDDYVTWLLGQEYKRSNDSHSLGGGGDEFDANAERDLQLWTMFDSGLPCDRLYPDASTRLPAEENGLVVGDSTTFSGRIQNTVRYFFKAVWRWCRFVAILTTAVLINVWNGPDSMLLQN